MKNFKLDLRHGRKHKFVPDSDPEGKENYTRHVFVDTDGSTHEAIRMNVLNDRHREEIVAFHFCRQFAELRYGSNSEPPQFYLIGRDCPWDFEYVLHDASTFFLEICRIADENLLKCIKRENDCIQILQKPQAFGFQILKVESMFPGTIPVELTQRIRTKKDKETLFAIPSELKNPRMFIRPSMNPRINLTETIKIAIQKKSNKGHKGKHETILILDNLTTHSDPDDFFDAIESLSSFLSGTPFDSIWIYTGYYSDNDGNECEYSLTPIKLNLIDEEILSRRTME